MPPRRTTPKGYQRARELRGNLTLAEQKLWKYLRAHRLGGAGFRRQHAIGPYIVDFCSPRFKIIIEVDGSQHADQVEYDSVRTEYFTHRGYYVIRFWNNEVMGNIEGVIQTIIENMQITPSN
ncbi:MAG: endonuclease domain-containing protein [Anaerolineales bacterium]